MSEARDIHERLAEPFPLDVVEWKLQATTKDCTKAMAVGARFWSKVKKTETCWNWTAGRNHSGYGYFNKSSTKKAMCVLAHRWSYEEAFGTIPDGLCVLHRCDNPQCVRPEHLFLGTRTDNANDKVGKGRQRGPKGQANHKAIVSAEDVRIIRARHRNGEAPLALAKLFGLSRRNIYSIVHRTTWSHIP